MEGISKMRGTEKDKNDGKIQVIPAAKTDENFNKPSK